MYWLSSKITIRAFSHRLPLEPPMNLLGTFSGASVERVYRPCGGRLDPKRVGWTPMGAGEIYMHNMLPLGIQTGMAHFSLMRQGSPVFAAPRDLKQQQAINSRWGRLDPRAGR